MAGGGDLSFRVSLHPRYGWLVVRVQAGQPAEGLLFDMAISTLSPTSGISVATRNALLTTGHLVTSPDKADRFLLRDLRIEGQSVPDLEVGISGLASRAKVSGFLGLNFFEPFVSVHLHLPTLEVRLTRY